MQANQRHSKGSVRKHLEQSTIIRDYNKIEKRIRKFPAPYLEKAVEIQSYLLEEYAAETAKRTLEQLSVRCGWASRKNLISNNPFLEMSKEIRTKKTSRVSRKPFFRECAAAIISAFENNTYSSKYVSLKHSYYLPHVKFLLLTGCRPEEAIALKWKHLVEEGNVKEYLPQYNCRHTFITLCLEDAISSRRVADWCGTSVAVIETHYAGGRSRRDPRKRCVLPKSGSD